jgi:hypothetical protein
VPSPHIVRVRGRLKIPAAYDRDTSSAKFEDFSGPIRDSLLEVSAANRVLWLMNQECLELRWECTVDQKMAAVYGQLFTIPPRNSTQ